MIRDAWNPSDPALAGFSAELCLGSEDML